MRKAFADRVEAGIALGRALSAYRGRKNTLVLGLPRGGIPVAWEAAKAIGAPLDVLVVRKLGMPGHEELALGAIAWGGVMHLNEELIAEAGVTREEIEQVIGRERIELERRQREFRHDRPLPSIQGKCVILVDDGLATGATMHAAAAAIRKLEPEIIVLAVPVAPIQTIQEFGGQVDQVICLLTPDPFGAVGRWYESFPQLEDREVIEILHQAWSDERN